MWQDTAKSLPNLHTFEMLVFYILQCQLSQSVAIIIATGYLLLWWVQNMFFKKTKTSLEHWMESEIGKQAISTHTATLSSRNSNTILFLFDSLIIIMMMGCCFLNTLNMDMWQFGIESKLVGANCSEQSKKLFLALFRWLYFYYSSYVILWNITNTNCVYSEAPVH